MEEETTVSMYSKQNIFSFCSIIFNFSFIFYFFVGALERQSNGNFFWFVFLSVACAIVEVVPRFPIVVFPAMLGEKERRRKWRVIILVQHSIHFARRF